MRNQAIERLDAPNESVFITEKYLHLARYSFASKLFDQKAEKKGFKSLDIACGTGYGTMMLNTERVTAYGVDIDKEVIRQNKRNYPSIRDNFSDGSITSIAFENQTFSGITCFETIEHISRDQGESAAQELFRVSKSGGLCVVSSPNRFWMKMIHIIKPNTHHIHEYYPGELKMMFEQHGWKHIQPLSQMPFIPVVYPLINRGLIDHNRFTTVGKSTPQSLSLYHLHVFVKR